MLEIHALHSIAYFYFYYIRVFYFTEIRSIPEAGL